MDYFQAIILGIVEGITEFLPISSTGHLILASDLLNIFQTEFVKSFEIIIQLGAILAVFLLYFKKFMDYKLWPKILAAFLPTAIIGLMLYKLVKSFLLGNTTVVLLALFLGGIALIILEKYYQDKKNHLAEVENITLKQAVIIGVIQSLSIIPGVSRSAATIFGGLFMGLNRKTAVEFSFLLAVPTMVAATSLDLIKTNFSYSGQEYILLGIGLICSFLTALLAIKYFLNYIQHHTFIPFGVYRIILAIMFWVFLTK